MKGGVIIMGKNLTVIMLSAFCLLLNAQVPLETTPFWMSNITADTREITFADIDSDGDLDMAVSTEVPNVNSTHIYVNLGSSLEYFPSMMLPTAGSMGIAFGDVDNDGDPDVAVGYSMSLSGQPVKLFKNNGGIFDTIPAWTGTTGALWCGWGDVDGDGDLDLATVDILSDAAVYLNNNGILESSPSWRAADGYQWDIVGTWFDVDDDGDLDLAIGLDCRIYLNNNGILETIASWHPDISIFNSAGLTAGDINHDNLLDLAVGCGASGSPAPNLLFFNSESGLERRPSWLSRDSSMTWRVAFGDVNADGYLDLAAANFMGADVVYLNTGGILEINPSWSSDEVENSYGIAWVDLDNDGLVNRIDTLTGDGIRRLFYFSHVPIHKFYRVSVGGAPVPLSDYCLDPFAGWISLKEAPANGSEIFIQYSYSIDMELVVGSPSPAAYRNSILGIEEKTKTPCPISLFSITPTVLKKGSNISFILKRSIIDGDLSLYDILGKEISHKHIGTMHMGLHTWTETNKLVPGIYFLAISVNGELEVKKFLICE